MAKKLKIKMKFTDKQKDTLQKHSKHHSSKHMAMMKKEMQSGTSFLAAHKKAQKVVGA